MIGKPKYNYDDEVRFEFVDGEILVGNIYIVDKYGTFEQNIEPSYDIMVENFRDTNEPCLVKHIRESWILGLTSEK